MKARHAILGGAALVALGALAGSGAFAGPEKVTFPAGYQTKFINLGSIDRYDNKSVRIVYVNPEAYAQFKPGQPLPNGSMFVLEQRPARLGPDGNPMLNAEGRFVPADGPIAMVAIQAKGQGFGADVPENIRNGDWQYAVFEADGTLRAGANLQPCFTCHKPRVKDDFTLMGYRALAELKGK